VEQRLFQIFPLGTHVVLPAIMVSLAPPVDVASTTFQPKRGDNGIRHSTNERTNQEILVDTAKVVSSEPDSDDPVAIPANGNGASLLEQNVLKDPIVPPDSDVLSEDHNMTMEVLKIIESYGVDFEKSGVSWKGFDSFVPIVLSQIERQEPIRMILPAFPFKSPNARDKVLGNMPDFGEELALSHLNGLCQNIADVYEPGANVYISSDGLVYNGELQQSYSSSFH
jgi:hypothetical protein